MKLQAHTSSPKANAWTVVFCYVDADGKTLHGMPVTSIPVSDYRHARAVAAAFNKDN